ncbi:hypothetical protein MHH33_04850 [Paenisporosarcina sp. FSL H8-0542]|uniref:hypothetical protein n=1 Tax=Paenisporosarcina sp. FSL H8-0542 TaxID=2921401 RepID=UPI003159DD31
MNIGDFFLTIIVFIIPVLITGLLIYMFMSSKSRKNHNQLKDSLSEGVSKKQIK